MSMGIYHLDPAYYLSAPQLTWDAMLKYTHAKIELISDTAMFAMIDSGIRGGGSMISTRYGKAKEPAMGADYDASKPTVALRGVDANNLYGAAMSEPMPDGKFEWLDREVIDNMDWKVQETDQDFGYILMVDLD